MKSSHIIITLSCLINLRNAVAVEILRPRGVSVTKTALYDPEKNFTCFDGAVTIPFLQVNDDYCDCLDGSDEPGTAACSNGFFHCTNVGHQAVDLFSSRVNDGICDCCDGTDEFDGRDILGGGHCINICHEMGQVAREEAQRLAEMQKKGAELRREMARKAAELKAEKLNQLNQLKKDQEEALAIKVEKEVIKSQAEEKENAALAVYREAEEKEKAKKAEIQKEENAKEAKSMFELFDSDRNGRISLQELQTKQEFDRDRDGQVTAEEARFFLNENEEVGEDSFVAECWPRMKPFYMMNAGKYIVPGDGISKEDTDDINNLEEPNTDTDLAEEENFNEEVTDATETEDYHEETHNSDDEDHDDAYVEKEEEKYVSEVQYNAETQKIIDDAVNARHEYEEADRSVRDVEREIRQIEESLQKDYGIDGEFAALEGECFEYTDREYIYKLCPFDQASQRPKNGGGDTRLGSWGHWVGSEPNKYSHMMYTNGQSCWNGPQRSTKVELACGTENLLTAVSEPNRCEYKFDLQTPAACNFSEDSSSKGLHDEL
ncbi:glucosidase 2 subunit beta [Neocloeon triangulifer]|uniref:glucosidase 2 subunit beta n=1 Tax=Neocloeon triangulifer TaxID=2078957 RepID=UPI00286EC0BB|nr:glucosidase 2 subunit beta [Neocloeon triangulifer]XP_059479694.1 glucosidase 2 subunit beta [Neocloeon triangulifer]XP_059479695.1 glucosidase 2 subunit beta [Neocloeon triangulifer]